ncbi:MAG: thiamine pyrophosphate-dependent dehydrogenase E1 component subunit alpha [Pirellulales bacterium]|nr:thiamine pyrophosphate-dependent dehydrogenase E1 component subunit alpha [Pirellulales bacterium]
MAKFPYGLTADDLLKMYRLILFGRRYGESVDRWYKAGRLPQLPYISMGQEAVGVGACYGLRADDWVLPSLRTNEAYWTRGVTVLEQFHGMMGNAHSITGGRETSNHAAYPDRGILVGTGLIASQIPVAVGAAIALKRKGKGDVIVCFFGDGGSNRGDFHEALNLASMLKAPVVFVCENNGYGFTAPASEVVTAKDVADRAMSYAMPGKTVDGQDVLAVYGAAQEAVKRARQGEGPTLLECKTHRYLPHCPSVEEERPPEVLHKMRQRDPLVILGDRLQREGLLSQATIQSMEQEIRQELEDSLEQAEHGPIPEPAEVFHNLYCEPTTAMGL